LVALSQEKSRLDARNRANAAPGNGEDSDLVNQSFSSKQIILKQLQDKIAEQEKQVLSLKTNVYYLQDLFLINGGEQCCSSLFMPALYLPKLILLNFHRIHRNSKT
jgi:hypothetical protein